MPVTAHIIGFSIGGLLASVSPLLFLLLSPFILLLSLLRKRVFPVVFSCLLGVVWVSYHWFAMEEASLKESQGRNNIIQSGYVDNVSNQDFRIQFDFTIDDQVYLVSCYRCPYAFQAGEYWQLSLSLKPFHSLQNPNGFDYRAWMLSKGYHAKASVKVKHKTNHRLKPNAVVTWKQEVSNKISEDLFPILRALLLGDKTHMTVQQKRIVNDAGLSHLFVVSGLHIGMVAMVVVFIALALQKPLVFLNWRYGHLLALALAVLFACLYGYLSGLNTPAFRSVTMLLVASAFIAWKRYVSPVLYIWVALFFVILVTPLAFFDMGSWLSFGIVAALVMGFYGRGRVGFLRSLLLSQIIAFCMGAIVLVGFHQPVSIFGLLANLLLVPLMSLVIVPLAFLGLLLSFSWIGMDILALLEVLLAEGIGLIGLCTEWLGVHLPVHQDNRLIWLMALALMLVARPLKLRVLAVVCVLIALILPHERPDYGEFTVTIMDVGQGSSALVETQNHTILVDTGIGYPNSFTMVDFVAGPLLRRKGVDMLDVLHLTHDDADHSGGVDQLMPQTKQLTTQSRCQENKWQWDGVAFHRFQSSKYRKGNNGSCLLKVSLSANQEGSILFAGDIEKEAEQDLVNTHSEALRAKVLVVPHHGSKTSSSRSFIEAVSPEVGLVSAGFLNPYHHPHPSIIKRYEEYSVKIYSTVSHGAIEVDFSPRQANHIVSTYRPDFTY
jgi:competence protein ComEC